MLRNSRLTTLAFIFFFFQAGLLGTYIRCLEMWENFDVHSTTAEYRIQNSNSDEEVWHCPEEPNPYLIQAQYSVKKDPRTDHVKVNKSQAHSPPVTGYINFARYSGYPFDPLLSHFPYPAIAIYQAKVVYRI